MSTRPCACGDGNGAVRLLEFAREDHALLLERCAPATPLSAIHADDALEVLTEMLPRLWGPAGQSFRTLSDECLGWRKQLSANWELAGQPFDRVMLDDTIDAMDRFCQTQGDLVLVYQDLHGDNVLRWMREPWLAIDPKPLAGEREFSLAPIIRSWSSVMAARRSCTASTS